MRDLHGIGKLQLLLNNDSEDVQRAAAGALRNVVYQKDDIKMEVRENDGLDLILSALNSSRDVETRRQLTGQWSSKLVLFALYKHWFRVIYPC